MNYVDSLGFNTIIIARGGGSLEDLWNFNEEALARAIHNCKTPIISGVGHEIDYTIFDFVADCRCATPTAAGIKATPDLVELKQNVNNINYTLNTLMKQKITLNKQMLNKLNSFYLFKNPNKLFEDKKVKIDYLSDRLKDIFTYNLNLQSNKAKNLIQTFNHQANLFTLEQKNHLNLINQTMEQLMKQKIKYEKEKLYYTLSKLNTLSPLKVLERGYAIVLKEDNVVLTVNELKTGDKIKIKMKDGSKNAIIE